jgi:PncC family amidohydrolase
LAGTWDQLGLERILLTRLEEKGLSLALAESCTGGYISHLVTKVPGASKVLKGSVVVYSNEMKEKLLGVNEETLTKYGAVSEEVVIEMCRGLEKNFGVDCGIAVSGIAGPDGGSPDKPVGTVWIACLFKGRVGAVKHHFSGDRMQVISQAARYGIQGILDLMDGRKF